MMYDEAQAASRIMSSKSDSAAASLPVAGGMSQDMLSVDFCDCCGEAYFAARNAMEQACNVLVVMAELCHFWLAGWFVSDQPCRPGQMQFSISHRHELVVGCHCAAVWSACSAPQLDL